jgi:alkylhydroperoxidase family enzyme
LRSAGATTPTKALWVRHRAVRDDDSKAKPHRAAPEAMKASVAPENYVRQSGLDHSRIELVQMSVSQFNGCGYCISFRSVHPIHREGVT